MLDVVCIVLDLWRRLGRCRELWKSKSKYRSVAVSADELEAAESYAGTVEEHARYCSLLYVVARADDF